MRTVAIISLLIVFNYIDAQIPVNANSTQEVRELLSLIYSISGQKTLTGQHGYPLYSDIMNERVHNFTGEYPALFGQDFGFSEANSLDGINFRQRVIDNAIKWNNKGMIITLMWHAVPPTMDEPVTFKEGIQSKLTDEEWKQLITDGSELNQRWKSQVDVIAFYLKQLQDAGVPVIWRPYHEMNGKWFWWGGREGTDGYQALYKMLYDRLVNFHKINNLLWVFNGNEINPPNVETYNRFFPGLEYVDILATDVYHNNFQLKDYQSLLKLANGKPIALGEVGHMPTADQLEKQPNWAWFMTWSEFLETANTYEEKKAIYSSDRTITLEELNSLNKTISDQ